MSIKNTYAKCLYTVFSLLVLSPKLDIKFDGTILPCPAFKELDVETMKKHGIKHYSIYENLEEVKTPGGKRVEPLCSKIYKKEK